MTDQPTRYAVKSPQRHVDESIFQVGEVVDLITVCRDATSTLNPTVSRAKRAIVRAADGRTYSLHPNSLFPLADDLWAFEDTEGDMMRNVASPDRAMQIAPPTLRSMEEAAGERFRQRLHRQRGGAWECVQAIPSGLEE